MKKITCISYHNSGSGAVDDFLREFDGIQFAPSDVEARFLQDPDGISDLEYNLVDNWHRLNSGFAIKRFEKFANYYNHTYSLIFGSEWKNQTKQYVQKLIDFSFPGYWHADVRLQNDISQLIYKLKRGISKLSPQKYRKSPDYNYYPNLISYHSRPDRETFYRITRDFCENLCNSISHEGTEYIVLDQCVSTTNISRYLNYIDDLKVIIVDRDPRDLFIQGIRGNTHVLPHNPSLFAVQYMDMRFSIDEELKNPNVIKIQFEDLIYNYDQTTKLICDFLGLDPEKHIRKKEFFNPAISIKNTQMWKRDKGLNMEINELEKKLKKYFYEFPEEYKD